MNRNDLAEDLAKAFEISVAQAERMLKHSEDRITATLARGETVELHGFGKFSTKVAEGRTGRNPQTGETIQIAPVARVSFHAAAGLKRRLEPLARAVPRAAE